MTGLWFFLLPLSHRMSAKRINRVLLLEAETRVRLDRPAADWKLLETQPGPAFSETREVPPMYWLEIDRSQLYYRSSNWPKFPTRDDLPFDEFYAGEPIRIEGSGDRWGTR